MGDRAFGMLCGYIRVTGLAMLNGFLEMLDPFIHMRILPGRPRMLEGFLCMLHDGIGMPLFAMRHCFLGMLQGFSRMLVGSKGKPAQVYDMKKVAEQKASELRANSKLSSEDRTAALQAIRAETERSMQQTLGEKGWQSYNKQNNTWWLKSLSPDPKPPAPTPTAQP